jgi:hypothetical protein
MVCAKHTTGLEIILDAPDCTPWCVYQAEAHFDPFVDSFNFGARKVHSLRRMYHGLRNRFGHTRWYSYVMYAKWKLISIHLEIVLISTKVRCTVGAKCTMGLEIFSGTPDGPSR